MGKVVGTTGSERHWMDNGTGSVLIPTQANNQFGTGSYTFPLNSGAGSQVIADDGNGSLYWANQSGGGGSIYVGSAPITITTGSIWIPPADVSTDGHLTSTDWATFNNKSDFSGSHNETISIQGGSPTEYYHLTNDGVGSLHTVTTVSGSPLSISGQEVSIDKADTSTDGYLGSEDWQTFNNKSDFSGSHADLVDMPDSTGSSNTDHDNRYLIKVGDGDMMLGSIHMNDNPIENLGYVQWDTAYSDGHNEGKMHWDDDEGGLNIGMKGGVVELQVGQEMLFRAKAIGTNIDNGEVVYISGGTGNFAELGLAKADASPTFRAIGVATEDITQNQFGYINTRGLVRDLDTTGPGAETWSAGDALYLSGTTAGLMTNVKPDAETYYNVVVGHVIRVHASEGVIMTNIVHFPDTDHIYKLDAWGDTNYPTRTEWGQNGFKLEGSYNTDSVMTFTAGTRTFSIQPSGAASFDYWILGKKYTTTGDTVVCGDGDTGDEGVWVIWYDGSTLTATQNPTNGQVSAVIRGGAICAILYWNATDEEIIYFGEERHGKVMSPSVHAYLHFLEGLRYMYGLGLNTITADEDGSATTHAQFGIDAGAVSDEDIYAQISAVPALTGLPIYYMLGDEAGPRWVKYEQAGYCCRTFDGTASTRLAYNQNNGGTWQLTEESNGDFVLYHIFGTTEKDKPMISIMGQNGYSTKGQARDGAESEINELILNDVLFPEIRPIATIIFQTKLSYADPVNARIVSTDEGDDYIDWRNKVISRVELSTDVHGNLSGLANDDHTQYLLADGSRDLTGPWSISQDLITTAEIAGRNFDMNWSLNASDGEEIILPGVFTIDLDSTEPNDYTVFRPEITITGSGGEDLDGAVALYRGKFTNSSDGSILQINGNYNHIITGDANGVNAFNAYVQATGNITTANGVLSNFRVESGKTVTTYKALNLTNTINLGTITNYWGVYQEDANASNLFNGDIQAEGGITSTGTISAEQLTSTDDITASGLITAGEAGRSVFNEGMIVNEGGTDSDTRIESDDDANCLFVDGGEDRVGIGTGTPGDKLEVSGAINRGGIFAATATSAQTCTGPELDINLNSSIQADTTYYTHDTGSNPEQVTVLKTGLYRITYGINLDQDVNDRRCYRGYVQDDGTAIEHSRSMIYLRTSNEEARYGTLTTSFIASITANSVIKLSMQGIDSLAAWGAVGAADADTIADQVWLNIEKIA